MVNNSPKISIVTPSFNQGRFIEKTITSVLGQNYPNLEYIIIDGGSTDESVEIIKKYEKRLAYWASEQDRGQSHAINKGFERATGDIFGWLNSDDWYHPGALKAVAEAFAVNPNAGAVVGAGEMYFEEYGNSTLYEPYPLTFKTIFQAIHQHLMQPSCFFTHQAWCDCGPLDETLNLAMDFDLWLRIAKKYHFTTIPQNLSVSLVHKSAKTTALAAQSYADSILVMIRHGGYAEARDVLVDFLDELLIKRKETAYLQNELYYLLRTSGENQSNLANKIRELAEINSALRNSLSWRLTKPIRQLLTFVRKVLINLFITEGK